MLLAAGGQSFTPGTRNYTFDAGFVPTIPPTPLPTVPSVLPSTVRPPATVPDKLPETGSRTRMPLALAVSLSLMGSALVIISRPRKRADSSSN